MTNQTTTILDFPAELRDKIVACLDIKDVLSLSLTCKHFHAIVESRQTWMKFVQETQSQPNISRIEEPVEDFTTEELRDWVLRRHKIRQSLRSGSRATCHYIRGTDNAHESVLLPGGRWLLFENSLGNIFYVDCGAPRPEAQSLITFEDIVPDRIKTQFVIWRDSHSPRLSFRVAFLYWYNREDGNRAYQAHFYKINLVGHGSSAKLVAECLHQYQGSIPDRETSGEGIRGEYFYQIHHMKTYGIAARLANRRASLEILDYGSGSSVAKQVKLVDFYYSLHMWRFDILPDGRIVVSGATHVVIYPDPLSITGDEMKTLAPSLVINNLGYTMRGGFVNMSDWYFGPDSNMVVYGASGKSMVAVWIPHDGTAPMKKTIQEVMGIDHCIILGLFYGVDSVSRRHMSIFSYPWRDSHSQTGCEGVIVRTFNIERAQDDDTYFNEGSQDIDILYFNEEFGRVIIRDPLRGYSVINIVAT